ncbi:hypothetical protein RQP46_001822 [Phenoliferia psychrophenolica]
MQEPNPLVPYLNGLGGDAAAAPSPSVHNDSPASGSGHHLAPAPPVKEVTLADLAAELPVITNDLVPLSFIVERVVGQVYTELATLAEILPSTPEPERKRKIVDYVLQTRRQILKLLVLVRWSSEADNVAKCMNIIGFLARQNFEFDHTVDSLTEVKTMLAGARVRNYDLPTAITVLTTGTYTGLPSILADSFAQPTTLPDEVVLRTLQELDDVLRWRLSCVEVVPRQMRRYWIADGRVTFHVAGLWEASLTYGGASEDETAEWYLLSVKFLFRVKDARGVWSSIPVGPMKEHIVELCNRELAKRRPPPETDLLSAVERAHEAPDAPLTRGYAFLQRLALSYQVEALYIQACELAATAWTGNLRVELAPDRQELRIEYWAPPPVVPAPKVGPSSHSKSPSNLPAPPQGLLTLSIRSGTEPPTPVPPKAQPGASSKALAPPLPIVVPSSSVISEASTTAVRDQALHRALARGESTREPVAVAVEASDVAPERVQVLWAADGLSESTKSQVPLDLDSDLNLESLLLRTTAAHARESTLQLYHQLVNELDPDDLELVEPETSRPSLALPTPPSSLSSPPSSPNHPTPTSQSLEPVVVPNVRVHLHGQHHILASVNPLSGKLEFRAVGEVPAIRETRLRSAADTVDKDRKRAGETIMRVRASTIVDEVDSRATFLGFVTSRRIAIRAADYVKFGVGSRSFLFVHLPQLPNNFLVLVLAEEGFRFALAAVREVSEALQTFLVLEEVGWLDKSPTNGDWEPTKASGRTGGGNERPAAVGTEVSVEDLRDLYQYCVRRIAFFKVEQQLHIRRIPYTSIASYSPTASPPSPPDSPTPPSPTFPSSSSPTKSKSLSSSSPYLVIQASDLLRSTARVAYPNIAIQCFLVDDVIRTTLHVRFRDLALAKPDPAELPSNMAYDPKTSIVTFTSDDIDTCVPTFLTAYSLIARAIVLARSRASEESGGGALVPSDGEEAMEGIL